MLGRALIRELRKTPRLGRIFVLTRQPRKLQIIHEAVRAVRGNIEHHDLALSSKDLFELSQSVTHIVHAAADTRFNLTNEQSTKINSLGTEYVLAFADNLPHFRKGVHVSSACVAGNKEGLIREEPITERPTFMNGYEASKWEAEQHVVADDLSWDIVRAGTVIGSETDGSVPRLGAVHRVLEWVYRGLIPMLPGTDQSRVDLVSEEHVARVVRAALLSESSNGQVYHASAGDVAAPLPALIDAVHGAFQEYHDGWRRRVLNKPLIVRAGLFNQFERSVRASKDLLFNHIADHAATFLPALYHPRVMAVEKARQLIPSHFPGMSWQSLVQNAVQHHIRNQWKPLSSS